LADELGYAIAEHMLSKRITMRDVAERLGVSHTTVAMALRNHHTISPQRREQVRVMAEKMGYRPDPFLSSLAAYRKQISPVKVQGAVAWINHWQQPRDLREKGEYITGIWRGASKTADRFGYHLDDIHWSADCSVKRFEQILLARGVRGVLIPPHNKIPDWGDLDWSKFSIVRFGLSVPNPDSNLVTVDHFRAVVMAVQRIKEYGYTRIGLVVGEEYNLRLGGSNVGGFLCAQDMLRLKPALPPLKTEYGSRSAGELTTQKSALRQWLKKYTPDAILTTDAEIPGLIRELGYHIPNDIAVAGTTVHDIPVDAGIEQHSEAVGRIAMETLAKQMNVNECGEPPDPTRILVEARWKDGKSLPRRR
jgi:DNA-binding LacI/PurR family transcriptional regulator